jgi:UDP-3-O-[3-hydroxymyristoyl] glucosamine N-acyltransferase
LGDATLREIAAHLGGELIGDASLRIDRIGPLDGATPSTISFLANPKYQSQLAQSRAGCVLVSPTMRDPARARGAAIVLDDPYLGFARLTQWWAARMRAATPASVHPSAVIDASARLGAGVSVGPLAVIEAGAAIGDGAVVGAHGVVGAGAVVGAGTRLAPHVVLGAGCRIGARGVVHAGVVIGADGFGFAPAGGRWEKIEQLGNVRIGDDVEIGANTCIDRGALGDTVIEDGVKLDNQIQIGHNCRIGAHTAMAGCVGVAGSAVIGKYCTFGGAAMVLGHLTIADHVHISSGSMVSRSILQAGQYTGFYPLATNAEWEKSAAIVRNLGAMRNRLRELEKTVALLTVHNKKEN